MEIRRILVEATHQIPRQGYFATVFRDKLGKLLGADYYTALYPSNDWTHQTFVFRARHEAKEAAIRFAGRGKAVDVKNVSVKKIDQQEAVQWADGNYEEVPEIGYTPPENRFENIPRTAEVLRNGGEWRVVMLGDSIMNDTGNSLFPELIEQLSSFFLLEIISVVWMGNLFLGIVPLAGVSC